MSTLVDSFAIRRQQWSWGAIAIVAVLMMAAMAIPNLMRSRVAANDASRAARMRALEAESANNMYYAPTTKDEPVAIVNSQEAASASAVAGAPADASSERKIIRSSSLAIVVQHPAQVMDKIMALAEMEGGYLESSQGGGQDAASGSLTIRVPAARFEETRAEIRKLGLRVENETITAQDVTRQYVDQDANLRNLRAEETQYLAILKQANTVKDLLAVSQRISEVRGQIEQQQAEFNALSKQTEAVAIAISLRTEAETQVFGLNWRPLYQLKLALRDGLESVAGYASAMTAFLFYLPAVLLWVGTIVGGMAVGWRLLRWVGRRWFAVGKANQIVHGAS
jgi:hypothetical protein